MRLLFINQYYRPDYAATAQILSDLAEEMADIGHEVHVLASKSIYDGRKLDLPSEEIINGVHVHRVSDAGGKRDRLRQRAMGYLSFHAAAHFRAMTLPRPDVVVSLTTPPLICLVGAWSRLFRGSKHVPWIMDIYPEIAVKSGVLRSGGIVDRIWSMLRRISFKFANQVVVLSPGMRDVIASKGVALENISVLQPWSDTESITPFEGENHFRREHVPPTAKRVVMYSGNLGTCHLWREFAGAVELMEDNPEFFFLFVGGGKGMPLLKEKIGQCRNVKFLPYQDREILSQSLAAGDIHLTSLDPRVDGLLMPSKIFGIMAASRPIVHVGSAHSDVAKLLDDAGCGVVVPPGDPSALADMLLSLPDTTEMGRAGRGAIEEKYDKKVLISRFIKMLEQTQLDCKRAPSPVKLP
ncbi:MAG: glycosyltransferase family 4 protein [Candidatus Sumerlaeia bacterium]|nr:glycosyltransferase family 4 protein [Candidatus Sumerlaeia bacterium]